MIKVGSDFSGVGAFNQALKRLGVEYKEVFACDMDKHARQTFIHNYGEPDYYPENVYNREIPTDPLDIYMTSPPCQAFSLAGKRKGKEDLRGILFFNSLEFIAKNKPRFFIFENVKGLLSDDGGKTFSEWVNMLGGKSVNGLPVLFPYEDSVPYHLYWQVLNAKKHGVPQNRERVFLVGIRDDKDNTFQFPNEETLAKRLKDVLEENVDDKYFLSEKMIDHLQKHERSKEFINLNTLHINCLTSNYSKQSSDLQYLELQINNKKEIMIGAVRGRYCTDKKTEQKLEINKCGTSNTITCVQKDNVVVKNKKIRRLTPRECFRLMDFPDSFTWPVSDSQAYKQAGNSIVVNVLYKILKNLPL